MSEKRPVVVIGHRFGKGEQVAAGVEKAGGTAIVISGMAADMRLGDVMHENNADFGISFCGSGGAGAITAGTKYGWKNQSHLDSPEAAVTALKDGCKVIGMPFNDTEEVGEKLTKAWLEMNQG